ncbi:MAG TPA: B12-binding domain-containing radical SAM protein [Candidatus Brocadiia bacterium]|nr:B12-binding domain-containing radical SAM protein [Candidatus Brocadiales bacterium]
MNGHILLINPWIHDFAAYDLWLKPLGLLYIGALLEKSGYKVSIINCLDRSGLHGCGGKEKSYGCGNFFAQEIEKPPFFKHIPRRFKRYGITPEIFRQKLLSASGGPEPDVICVTSAMTYWYPGVFEAIKISKSVYPSVPIILGGIYATLCHEHAIKYSGADYVIKGAGELEVVKLVDSICGNKHDYEFIDSDLRPAYNLLEKFVSVSMLTSRGCPFRCTYCASHFLQSTFKRRQPEKVVDEIEHYVNNLGVKDIAFYDDALLVNPQGHIIPILKMIIKEGIAVRFHTPNGLHLKYIDIQLAHLLKMANFKTIRLGFESSNVRRQNDSDNKTTNEQLAEALNNLRSAGFDSEEIGVYIMMGLPDETYEEILETIVFVNKCGGRIKTAQYSPIPGTLDFEKALKKNPLLKDEPLLHNNSTYPLANESTSDGLTFDKYEKLKSFANKLNVSLINLPVQSTHFPNYS